MKKRTTAVLQKKKQLLNLSGTGSPGFLREHSQHLQERWIALRTLPKALEQGLDSIGPGMVLIQIDPSILKEWC